jgi:hypothetical protein
MERLVDKHLRDETLVLSPLHPNQRAYQAGKSTEMAVHHLVVQVDRRSISKIQPWGSFWV